MLRTIKYDDLATADLLVNAVYEGKEGGFLSGEPLSKLLPGIGNLGGFRASGTGKKKRFVVLCTSGKDEAWPDRLDSNTGRFVYYGDNRSPDSQLHSSPGGGNQILRDTFEMLHVGPDQRRHICPFFVFQSHPTRVSSRSFQFKGLAVPGQAGLSERFDLVAFWTTLDGQRFLNYRATFTILNIPCISRAWVEDLAVDNVPSANAPPAWLEWVEMGKYRPLIT